MNSGTLSRTRGRDFCAALAAGLLLAVASTAEAQLLYSFETGLNGWAGTGFTGSDFISVAQSTSGFTEGTHSMAVETGAFPPDNGFGWDVGVSVSSGPVYDAFNAVSAEPNRYVLEFDVTITNDSFAAVMPNIGPFFLISASVNSDAGFQQVFNVTPNLITVDAMSQNVPIIGTVTASIPMNTLPVAPDAGFYQLNIGSNKQNSLFVNGPGPTGATYYVDNIRFRKLPVLVPETIFSWETPDDPGTTGVNEQMEGWIGGTFSGNPPHVHSIVTTGATDGTYALQIDRTSVSSQAFTWGSLFVLNSDTDPDPMVENIDPVVQARIDDLITKVEAAERVAFDVTYQYQDLFPLPDPTFTNFAIHFSDESGVFYQKAGQNIDVVAATEPTTVTVEIPLDQFVDFNTGTKILKTDGFVDNSSFFRIGISTSTDGPQIYQIDNFRLLTAVPEGVPGDYNGDLVVDAADYTIWRDHLGQTFTLDNENPAASTPGLVDAEDYNFWKSRFGATSGSGGVAEWRSAAVPEPTSSALTLLAIAGACLRRRRPDAA